MNLEAAHRFAKALGVTLDSISPKLAAIAVELFGATEAGRTKPQTFEGVLAAHAKEIAALKEADRRTIEAMRASAKEDPKASQKYIKALLTMLES